MEELVLLIAQDKRVRKQDVWLVLVGGQQAEQTKYVVRVSAKALGYDGCLGDQIIGGNGTQTSSHLLALVSIKEEFLVPIEPKRTENIDTLTARPVEQTVSDRLSVCISSHLPPDPVDPFTRILNSNRFG